MSMYRSYLLKNDFWAKKGNEKNSNGEKIYIKHDLSGPVYAIIQSDKKGVRIVAEGQERLFNNFDKLDLFLNNLKQNQDYFTRLIRRKSISNRLRTLNI